ncbi:MAG: Na(+)/H(+) antiporter subunit C [Mobilicoccus sp.]|nr:Na(+)/H(+) antiporter subunit C [Mobilicoccus sp.]
MTANVSLSLLIGVLFGTGISLLMARGIIRAFLGVLLVSNGINLLFVVAAGPPGSAPILSKAVEADMSDPLPQAMTLTAIVITLALTGFAAALAHRSWQLQQSDVITDDPEDVRIHEKAVENDISDSDFLGDEDDTLDVDDPGGRHHHDAEEGRP